MRKPQKRHLIWAGVLVVVLLLLPPVFKYGYCHGWWGKENLVMRALWMCSCSPGFEQSLYPENVVVLVSACECKDYPHGRPDNLCGVSMGVPGGRYLFARNILLDLYTNQRIPLELPPHTSVNAWLTEDLLWTQCQGRDCVFSRSMQRSVEMTELPDGWDEQSVLDLMRRGSVFYVDEFFETIIILGPEFWDHPESNIYFYKQDIPSSPKQLETYLTENGIQYERGSYRSKQNEFSPSKRTEVRMFEGKGVYDTATGVKISELDVIPIYPKSVRYSRFGDCYTGFYPFYWRSDEKEIVFLPFSSGSFYAIFDPIPQEPENGWGIFIDFPQPVLGLMLTDEQLQP